MKIMHPNNPRAFTVIELMVVVFVVVVLAALLLSGLARSTHRRGYPSIQCVNNLRQVGLSFRMWASDNLGKYPMEVSTNAGGTKEFVGGYEPFRHFQALSNELNTPKVLSCRDDERIAATNFTTDLNNTRISYFVGLDANQNLTNSILAGDRKLENGTNALNGTVDLTREKMVSWSKTIHSERGNFVFGDGSVRKLTTKELTRVLAETGLKTNRVVFP